MIVKIDQTFEKDIDAIHDVKILKQISSLIEEAKTAFNIYAIKGIKKLKGYKRCYRVRIGDYRAGLIIENNIVEFIHFLHRKDIYKRFP